MTPTGNVGKSNPKRVVRRVKNRSDCKAQYHRCLFTLVRNPCLEQFSKLFKERVGEWTFNDYDACGKNG